MDKSQQNAPWARDCMDRGRVARFLTRHLDDSSHIKVLNVNSEWGSGKTFFITEWQKEARENRVCVYFDAWKHDYTGDPFVSLVATIKDQLEEQTGGSTKARKMIVEFTKSAAKTLLAATPVVAKGLVKKISSIDIDAIHAAAELLEDIPADAAEKAVEELINSKKAALKSVEDFKIVFSKLLKASVGAKNGGETSLPAYIFIDELDRCRPTFAIELLERIKHLFDIEGCKFIIASDTEQLAHSITAIYGNNFHSHKYLKRFFDAEFELDNSDMENWVKTVFKEVHQDSRHATKLQIVAFSAHTRWNQQVERRVNPDPDTVVQTDANGLNVRQAVILALVNTFKPRLRELEKLVNQINAFEKNCTEKSFQFFYAAYLLFLKDADRNLYRAVVKDNDESSSPALEAKFPGSKLYFGDTNANVHDIAKHYLKCSKAVRAADISDLSAKNYSVRYIGEIYNEFYHYFEDIKLYPGLVDLAHRLDN